MKKAKILALDPGKVNIGVAVSDPDCIMAFARQSIRNSNNSVDEILNICANENIGTIVVGKLHHEGKHSVNRKFVNDLRNKSNIKVIEFDEDFSTHQAIEQLKESGASVDDIKNFKDSFAARIILERYLQTQ